MTAFLKIDRCKICQRALPWEWIPAVLLSGKTLAGTGLWRSQLIDGRCSSCIAESERMRREQQRALARKHELRTILGGEKPYREFTFERFMVAPGNRLAYERCKRFDPATENLYLWGACGVGKTHLAYASGRRCFDEALSLTVVLSSQLSRQLRMKDPDYQQGAIDVLARSEALVLDDVGTGPDTAYSRQILQEILDQRDFHDRAGLIVTSKYSLNVLALKLNDDAIPSRLAGMCAVIEVKGNDHRLKRMVETKL